MEFVTDVKENIFSFLMLVGKFTEIYKTKTFGERLVLYLLTCDNNTNQYCIGRRLGRESMRFHHVAKLLPHTAQLY